MTLNHPSVFDSYIFLLPRTTFVYFSFSIVPSLQPIMDAASFYPLPTKEALAKEFVGRSIKDVPAPAAILDVSKAKNNCARMLEACDKLGFAWRAHIKTHKVGMSRSCA